MCPYYTTSQSTASASHSEKMNGPLGPWEWHMLVCALLMTAYSKDSPQVKVIKRQFYMGSCHTHGSRCPSILPCSNYQWPTGSESSAVVIPPTLLLVAHSHKPIFTTFLPITPAIHSHHCKTFILKIVCLVCLSILLDYSWMCLFQVLVKQYCFLLI